MRELEGLSPQALLERFGSPLFVVSAASLSHNYRSFREAFAARYRAVRVAYACKANGLAAVLDLLRQEGAWLEVVSGFEYDLGRAVGFPGSHIVFNGPYKDEGELRRAAQEGALINLDHEGEILLLEGLAQELGRRLPVGLRLNLRVGLRQAPDRFGFSLESGEAMAAARRIVAGGRLELAGLHVHLTSYILSPQADGERALASRVRLLYPKGPQLYRRAAAKLVALAKRLQREMGVKLNYLDLGGGYPSPGGLAPYVAAVTEPLEQGPWPAQERPLLILEPGRALVANAVYLLARVVATKELGHGRWGVTVDAGTNLLPTALWRWPAFQLVTACEGPLRETVLYGPLCLQTDVLSPPTPLPPVQAGDIVLFKEVGAYTLANAAPFTRLRPAVVLVEAGEARLVRRAEALADLLGLEQGVGEG